MAICIKMYDGEYEGRIIRVPDDMANKLVHTDKRAEFVSKSDWKEDGRSPFKKGGRV